jgi:TetR/AcrR family transcriptional regulator
LNIDSLTQTHHVDSKGRIALAAKEEFARFGFAGARVARIAKRSGLNKQLIFYYFGSKSQLYDAILTQACADLQPVVRSVPGKPSSRRLRVTIAKLVSSLDENADLARLLLGDRRESKAAAKLAHRTASDLLTTICDVVSEGQGLGYFRDDVDPMSIARHSIALVLGHLALSSLSGEVTSGQELSDQITDWLLRSLAW